MGDERSNGASQSTEKAPRSFESSEVKTFTQRIFEDILPFYLSIGVTRAEFFDSNPYELKAHITAYHHEKMAQDENNFYLMHYMASAVTYAVEHCLAGTKAKTELIKEPLLAKLAENEKLKNMTEDERYNYEVKKAIENEEKWIIAAKMKGLPETVV